MQANTQMADCFLHEHPAGATSWMNEKIKDLISMPGVEKVMGRMCTFGMMQEGVQRPGLTKRRIAYIGNCPKMLKRLAKKSQETTNMHY